MPFHGFHVQVVPTCTAEIPRACRGVPPEALRLTGVDWDAQAEAHGVWWDWGWFSHGLREMLGVSRRVRK